MRVCVLHVISTYVRTTVHYRSTPSTRSVRDDLNIRTHEYKYCCIGILFYILVWSTVVVLRVYDLRNLNFWQETDLAEGPDARRFAITTDTLFTTNSKLQSRRSTMLEEEQET